jgi:glutamine amidotransferase
MYLSKGKTVTLLEVGFGNLPSLTRVLNQLNIVANNVNSERDILEAQYLIIPGVGSFETAMSFLQHKKFSNSLRKRALEFRLPTLGICLGAQIMFDIGHEGAPTMGLSIFSGSVDSISQRLNKKISHTGWDKVQFKHNFLGIRENQAVDFFFNHDYIMNPQNTDEIYAECDFGGRFAVALRKFNCFAVQFHPEKSQKAGLTLIQNFLGMADV